MQGNLDEMWPLKTRAIAQTLKKELPYSRKIASVAELDVCGDAAQGECGRERLKKEVRGLAVVGV